MHLLRARDVGNRNVTQCVIKSRSRNSAVWSFYRDGAILQDFVIQEKIKLKRCRYNYPFCCSCAT